MVGVPNEVFSGFSFVAFITCVTPLYWHLEAWNIGTCMFIFWAGIGSLVFFINSIIWNHNVINWAPVWCDITTRFMTGIGVGIPATSLAINRRLYKISSVRAVMVTRSERRREMAIDLAITLGFPCVIMALQYVVQGHRFNIYEDIGCLPYTWNTPLAYVLVFMWPLITGICGLIYCSLTIRNLWKRGRQMREVLSQHSNLNSSRYMRLMMLAAMEILGTLPLATYIIWSDAQLGGPLPWVSWADTHFNFSKVDQFPRALWGDNARLVVDLEIQRWLTVACAFIFVAFFGFADEARRHYRVAYTTIASRLGVTTISSGTFSDSGYGTKGSKGVNVHISSHRTAKRDSFGTGLSTTISLSDLEDLSFMDEKERGREGEKEPPTPLTPTTPVSPAFLNSPTVYSPTDATSNKLSPTDSIASGSRVTLAQLTPSEHISPVPAYVPTDIPVIRAPEPAIRRARPESEIIAVDRHLSGLHGASAV